MKRTFTLQASGGTITHEVKGDVGGNSQETVIELKDGQFDFTEVSRTEDGVRITILGTWEAGEFMTIMSKLLEEHGSYYFEEIK